MSKYVQHRSGDGEKWEVDEQCSEHKDFYRVRQPHDNQYVLRLPKSEYVECSYPDIWMDVTAECSFSEVQNHLNLCAAHAMAGQYVPLVSGYRFQKIFLTDNRYQNTWILKVEKRQP